MLAEAREVTGLPVITEIMDPSSKALKFNATAADLRQETHALVQETDRIAAIPAEVLVAPMVGRTVNLAPYETGHVAFYAPAVIALLRYRETLD